MKNKYSIIIGIDPDVYSSGVAIMNVVGREIQLYNMSVPELIKYISDHFVTDPGIAAVVELDRSHKHNWHLNRFDTRQVAARKGFDQGKCYRTGEIICELLTSMNLTVIEKAPLIKCWSGPDRKITHDEMMRLKGVRIKTENGRSNQEQRDAMLLALDISGLPIILERKN